MPKPTTTPATTTDTDEQAFLAGYDASQYPRPSVAVDVALFTVLDDRLHVLLVRRADHPFKDRWALPGTFLGGTESLDDAAARALHAKADLDDVFLEQLYTFGAPGRDPRTRVLAVAYYALVEPGRLLDAVARKRDASLRLARIARPSGHPDEETGEPYAIADDGVALPMAFDHAEILAMAVHRLEGKVGYSDIGFQLLGETFTLLDLRRVHQAILARELNKDSFRRTMLDRRLVVETGEVLTGVGHRPPALYRFAKSSPTPDSRKGAR